MAFYLFLSLVAMISVALAVAPRSDGMSVCARNPLDPEEIWKTTVGAGVLAEEERRWLDELAVLELPRRHLIC
jgi:hypothetical protein